MREIKFRVWDIIAKEYIDSRYVSIDGFGSLHIAKHIIEKCFRPPHSMKSPWFIVEQSTGLRDKTDVEIYEGDILALYHRDGSIVNLCQVFWNELDNEYDWKPVGEDSWSDLFSAFYDDYKVVGNVHECTFN
nr:MAG TPA: YopX protein [Caudoviricetes sp.]